MEWLGGGLQSAPWLAAPCMETDRRTRSWSAGSVAKTVCCGRVVSEICLLIACPKSHLGSVKVPACSLKSPISARLYAGLRECAPGLIVQIQFRGKPPSGKVHLGDLSIPEGDMDTLD